MVSLVEEARSADRTSFKHDLQKFLGGPTLLGKTELSKKYPPFSSEVNSAWRSLSREEKAREVLLDKFQNKFGDLVDPGHYEFNALPQAFVPESSQAWEVADALLGGSFRGGIEQPFILDVRTHGMRLISEQGQRAITLNLIPGEEPLTVYHLSDFHRNETWNANSVIKEAGPLKAAEIFMNIATVFPVRQSI